MRSVDDVRAALAARRPRALPGTRRAAVAIAVQEHDGVPRLLFIERARRFGDPWSGDIAFPGGRVDPGDRDARAAAERETREEVGLDLRHAEPLGRLDDLAAGIPLVAPLVLSAFVYAVGDEVALRTNHEVQATLWAPVPALLDPARHVGQRWGPLRLPGVRVGDASAHVVWGLTYQLLEQLFAAAATPFPP
jgi:8-oxo-dGTP pyrophosphatase MutT (NUDIX family)